MFSLGVELFVEVLQGIETGRVHRQYLAHAENQNVRLLAGALERGMNFASGAAARMMMSNVSAWVIPATGERAPLRIFVAVRAIAPVAGMPPNSGLAILAMPCAISS